jgi:hypothetical protein
VTALRSQSSQAPPAERSTLVRMVTSAAQSDERQSAPAGVVRAGAARDRTDRHHVRAALAGRAG